MGLDTVEIILRSEEVFAVNLPDKDCSAVITVGDFYKLLLQKLELPYEESREIEQSEHPGSAGRNRSSSQFPSIHPWTAPDVWITLKAIIQDQLQVDNKEIREEARWIQDLGCD